jgi:hypothetical protein
MFYMIGLFLRYVSKALQYRIKYNSRQFIVTDIKAEKYHTSQIHISH